MYIDDISINEDNTPLFSVNPSLRMKQLRYFYTRVRNKRFRHIGSSYTLIFNVLSIYRLIIHVFIMYMNLLVAAVQYPYAYNRYVYICFGL